MLESSVAWESVGLGVHGALPLLGREGQRRQRVLVVEDDARLRRVVARLLGLEGYEAVEAGDGLEALACLQERAVEVILTDLCMPGMDGGQLIECLEALHPETPVIIISGECDARERFHLTGRRNLFRFLLKPIGVKTLLSEVEAALYSRFVCSL